MAHGDNEDDFVGRKPPVLRDIAVTAPRENEFATAVLGKSAEQRMIREQLESPADARQSFARAFRVVKRNEIEQPLEVGERSFGYLDPRQGRDRGRRTFRPARRASRQSNAAVKPTAFPVDTACCSDSAASAAKRARNSMRSASRSSASTMKACGLLRARAARRSMRRLRPSGSLRLVAATCAYSSQASGSIKVLPRRGGVKRGAAQRARPSAGRSSAVSQQVATEAALDDGRAGAR